MVTQFDESRTPILDDVSQNAASQFGIDLSLLDDALAPDRVPRTRTRTSHGLTLRVGGRIIGAVNALAHTHNRQLDDVWEIDRAAVGAAPADIVPQNVTGRRLTISRYDLYIGLMEEVMSATGEIIVLSDQFRPFSLRTVWQSSVGIVLGGRRIYVYEGCWFEDIGRAVRSTDDRIVNVNATIRYQTRRRVV